MQTGVHSTGIQPIPNGGPVYLTCTMRWLLALFPRRAFSLDIRTLLGEDGPHAIFFREGLQTENLVRDVWLMTSSIDL